MAERTEKVHDKKGEKKWKPPEQESSKQKELFVFLGFLGGGGVIVPLEYFHSYGDVTIYVEGLQMKEEVHRRYLKTWNINTDIIIVKTELGNLTKEKLQGHIN